MKKIRWISSAVSYCTSMHSNGQWPNNYSLFNFCFARNLWKVPASKSGSEMLSVMPIRGLSKSCFLPTRNRRIFLLIFSPTVLPSASELNFQNCFIKCAGGCFKWLKGSGSTNNWALQRQKKKALILHPLLSFFKHLLHSFISKYLIEMQDNI